ncbi:MAG: hypothetical protein AB7I37_12245 [Pirellulales bacterium]
MENPTPENPVPEKSELRKRYELGEKIRLAIDLEASSKCRVLNHAFEDIPKSTLAKYRRLVIGDYVEETGLGKDELVKDLKVAEVIERIRYDWSFEIADEVLALTDPGVFDKLLAMWPKRKVAFGLCEPVAYLFAVKLLAEHNERLQVERKRKELERRNGKK